MGLSVLVLLFAVPAAAESSTSPIVLRGSATDIAAALAENWSTAFERAHPGATIAIATPTGPPQAKLNGGLAAFVSGETDFAIVSRDLPDEDMAAFVAATGHPPLRIAVAGGSWRDFGYLDPVVFVVNDADPMRSVSTRELRALFGGRSRRFRVVGGAGWAGPLSARAQVVREKVLRGKVPVVGLGLRPGDAVAEAGVPAAVARDPRAIGFTGAGHVLPGTHVLAIDGVFPTRENVLNRRYSLARSVYLYIGKPTPALESFAAWLRGPDGQAVVAADLHFLPLPPLDPRRTPRH